MSAATPGWFADNALSIGRTPRLAREEGILAWISGGVFTPEGLAS